MTIKSSGTSTVLEMRDLERRELSAEQVRIEVHAASVNRADLLQRAGSHGPSAADSDAPIIVGLDAAGVITEVGEKVLGLKVGDRVMALAAGGLSEEVVVEAGLTLPIPHDWSFAEGAAAILGLLTEHNALRTAGRLLPGESVLIHAATSGVGLQGVQLAKHFGAGKIIATTRSTKGNDLLRQLGATDVIEVADGKFSEAVNQITGGAGADVVIDHVGGSYLSENIHSLAVKGRLVGVGRLGGSEGVLDMDMLALKRLELIGVTFRTRSLAEKIALVEAVRSDIDLSGSLDDLRPTIYRTMDWRQADEAHQIMESNSHLGKISLLVKGDSN